MPHGDKDPHSVGSDREPSLSVLPSRNPNPENQPLTRHSAVAAHVKIHEVKQQLIAG